METEQTAIVMEGATVAQKIREQLKLEVDNLSAEGVTPGLAVILVGDDEASQVYVKNKEKICEELGIYSEAYKLPSSTTQNDVIELIEKLNVNTNIHGILLELPLPSHIKPRVVTEKINPKKDVDAVHSSNMGRVMQDDYGFLPCTPAGIVELLEAYEISIVGKHCVIMGRSNIVGKPIAMMLLHADATVTMTHKETRNIKRAIKNADILVVAIGDAKFVKAHMVKKGAIVIDVGINYDEHGKLCGDVDFDEVSKIASYITPVPGGVGTMTTTMLMKNTVQAAKKYAKNM